MSKRPKPVVLVHPGAVSVTQLAMDLGVPAHTLDEDLEELMHDTGESPWTVDERVQPWAVDRLRRIYGGAA